MVCAAEAAFLTMETGIAMDAMLIALAVILAGVVAVIMRRTLHRPGAGAARNGNDLIPREVSIRTQPLLTDVEALFYNLLRLAVQDQYLLFAQVPLWCVVDVTAKDRKDRAAFFNRIALKRVDFVLVHPGTLTVAKVIELEDQARTSPKKQIRDRLVDAVLSAAEVELIRLDAQSQYTIPQLVELLALQPAD